MGKKKKLIERTWNESELMHIGTIVFKLYVTPEGDLLSEVKPVVLCDNDEVKTQIACITASLQDYISRDMTEDVEVRKAKLDRLLDLKSNFVI